MFCLFNLATFAQNTWGAGNFISLAAGPAFPVGGFAKRDIHKQNAGLATTGIVAEISYLHRFDQSIAMTFRLSYGRNATDKAVLTESSIKSIRPWEYYAIYIGPTLTGAIQSNIFIDLTLLAGTAYINSPKVNVNGELLSKKYAAAAIPLNLGTDIRFLLKNKFHLIAGVNYNYMNANSVVTVQAVDVSVKQKMNTVNANAGFGIRF